MGVTASSIFFVLVSVGLCYGGMDNKGMSVLGVVSFLCTTSSTACPSSQSLTCTGNQLAKDVQYRHLFATTVNWLFVYVVAVATPTGIETIGWKYYMLYAISNFCFIPIIWYIYVETAKLSLEQVDRLSNQARCRQRYELV
jgi:hypothetical protein